MVIAILWAPFIDDMGGLWDYLQQAFSVLVPPVVAIFILGALWKRGTDTAAFTTLWAGHGIAIAVFIATQLGYWPIHFTANVGLMTLVSCVIFAAVSLAGSHGSQEEVEGATWTREMATDALRDDAPIYARVTLWAVLLGVAMLAILVLFW